MKRNLCMKLVTDIKVCKRNLNIGSNYPYEKRILKMLDIVLLIIQEETPREKSSGNCKDDIKTNTRSTVRQERA
jgi:hypothetical protein